jgi:hypothetical protein
MEESLVDRDGKKIGNKNKKVRQGNGV